MARGLGVIAAPGPELAARHRGTAQLLLGRHAPNDHYLGGRFYRPAHGQRTVRGLSFALGAHTVHLFEALAAAQRRVPVPARALFPRFTTRYELTALAFAQRVESAGGVNYNAESRPTARLDRRYAELYTAAQRADLAFFKRPVYAVYRRVVVEEERFSRLRERLIAANVEHFTARGCDVIVRLGRMHSAVRRAAALGGRVTTQIGAGSFFPEQVLKRKLAFGLPVCEEDRMRAYVDRLLRLLPLWEAGAALPPPGLLFALAGPALAAVRDRCEAAVVESGTLPPLRRLAHILAEASGHPKAGAALPGDPRFVLLRRLTPGADRRA